MANPKSKTPPAAKAGTTSKPLSTSTSTSRRRRQTTVAALVSDLADTQNAAVKNEKRAAKQKKKVVREPRHHKVVRDSFTMPDEDYKLIDVLKKKYLELGVAIKKSEVLRAGLACLARLPNEGLVEVVGALDKVKTGRPPAKKSKKTKPK